MDAKQKRVLEIASKTMLIVGIGAVIISFIALCIHLLYQDWTGAAINCLGIASGFYCYSLGRRNLLEL